MSELLTQQTKNVEQLKQEMGPLKASQILRQTKVKQCKDEWSDGIGGPATMFCARGAIYHHFGWDGNKSINMEYWYNKEDELIPNNIQSFIQYCNDAKNMTFEEIADMLEEKGY